jgi:hypothetical protein
VAASVYPQFRRIMAAARQGQISPAGAVWWASQAARGQPVEILEQLTGPPGQIRLNWIKAAAADPGLAERVLEILLRLAGENVAPPGAGPPDEGALTEEEWQRIFPPGPGAAPPLVYEGEGQGRPDRVPIRQPDTSWDGYVSATRTPPPLSAVVRSAGRRLPHEEMTDAEADTLFPPMTEAEAARRVEAAADLAAARHVQDLADEDLHAILFGDTTAGESAG